MEETNSRQLLGLPPFFGPGAERPPLLALGQPYVRVSAGVAKITLKGGQLQSLQNRVLMVNISGRTKKLNVHLYAVFLGSILTKISPVLRDVLINGIDTEKNNVHGYQISRL